MAVENVVIAIDGPAGTGKSTCTRRLAEVLGFVHIDTGAIYRSIGLNLIKNGVDLRSEGDEIVSDTLDSEIEKQAIDIANAIKIEFKRDESLEPKNRVIANGVDVTGELRTEEVGLAASRISRIAEVRNALLEFQRDLGRASNSILEGRDIGTVVFPDASIKFFLTATVQTRAERRMNELLESGKPAPKLEVLKHQIEMRDLEDTRRKTAPLLKADDAIEIDTSEMDIEQVVNYMRLLIYQKLNLDKSDQSSSSV